LCHSFKHTLTIRYEEWERNIQQYGRNVENEYTEARKRWRNDDRTDKCKDWERSVVQRRKGDYNGSVHDDYTVRLVDD
jgi:hypothetical protein